jgi:hypothetical protein
MTARRGIQVTAEIDRAQNNYIVIVFSSLWADRLKSLKKYIWSMNFFSINGF